MERVFPVVLTKTKDLMAGIPFSTVSLQPAVVVAVSKVQLAMPADLVVAVVAIPVEITGLAVLAHPVKETLAERPAAVLHITVAAVVEVLAPLVAPLLDLLAAMGAQALHHR